MTKMSFSLWGCAHLNYFWVKLLEIRAKVKKKSEIKPFLLITAQTWVEQSDQEDERKKENDYSRHRFFLMKSDVWSWGVSKGNWFD